jgi:hypothetical protein
MELALALILFLGMIVSWFMLPGSTTTDAVVQPETSERGTPTITQPA